MPKQPIVFFGDSITYLGKWEKYFAGVKVVNLGVSGDKVADLEDRIDELYAAAPGTLFIMVGVNDLLSGYTVEETITEYTKLLDMCPDCKIYVQSVLPADAGFGSGADNIAPFNERLRALCGEKGIEYIDLFPLYDDGTGHLARAYTGDGLHLLSTAYGKWTERIRPLVEGEEN